jgi:hypothetical protein
MYLVLDGVPIDVQTDSGEEDIIDVGDSDRAFNGDYLQRIDTFKREWEIRSAPLSRADMVAMRDDILGPGTKTATGLIVGGEATTCYIKRGKITPVPDGIDVKWIITFTLIEK